MQNIKLTLQYDGTRYAGWQKPEKEGRDRAARTVSAKLQSALGRITGEIPERITGEIPELYAGARTEPGVHALEQTVSFHTGSTLSPAELKKALNGALPMDIAVRSALPAPERFRADLNARARTYQYRICTAPVCDPFTAAFTAHIFPAPARSAMQEGAAFLIGKHDFRNFCGVRKKKGTVKEILDISITKAGPDLLLIELTADDFLYRMPALIIGTLLEIGQGRRRPDCIKAIFEDTEKTGAPCETKGLLLKSISY